MLNINTELFVILKSMRKVVLSLFLTGAIFSMSAFPVKAAGAQGDCKPDEVTIYSITNATTFGGEKGCCPKTQSFDARPYYGIIGLPEVKAIHYDCSKPTIPTGPIHEDFIALIGRGILKYPSDCSHLGNYTYVPDPKLLPNQCIPNEINVPKNCSDFGSYFDDNHTVWSDYKILTDRSGITCCLYNHIPACPASISSCSQAESITRGTGTCSAGSLDRCPSPQYYTEDGGVCKIDQTKVPAAVTYFTSTDFEGVCGKGFVDTAIGCIPTSDFTKTIGFALRWLFLAAGGIIAALVIKNGYTIMTSAGNPEKLKEVRESFVAIITGVLLIIFSLTILKIVGADVLGLPGF